MEVEFVKGVGSGNDFVIIEKKYFKKDMVVDILNRIYGVGGDGLIVYEGKRMWFYNPDGSSAKLCGNGVRVLFLHLFNKGIVKENDKIITESGCVNCKIDNNNVVMFLPFCVILNENPVIVKCGVPHLIMEREDLEELDVLNEGFRFSNFLKERNNVDFFKIRGDEIYIRTYERGVERETLSCGSGIASVAFYLNKRRSLNKFLFKTKGGEFNVEVKEGIVGLKGDIIFTMKGVYLWKNI